MESAEIVDDACNPPPITTALLVSAAALVTHVGQAIVPVDVIVPPVIGEVVAILVTVPAVVHVIAVRPTLQVRNWPAEPAVVGMSNS